MGRRRSKRKSVSPLLQGKRKKDPRTREMNFLRATINKISTTEHYKGRRLSDISVLASCVQRKSRLKTITRPSTNVGFKNCQHCKMLVPIQHSCDCIILSEVVSPSSSIALQEDSVIVLDDHLDLSASNLEEIVELDNSVIEIPPPPVVDLSSDDNSTLQTYDASPRSTQSNNKNIRAVLSRLKRTRKSKKTSVPPVNEDFINTGSEGIFIVNNNNINNKCQSKTIPAGPENCRNTGNLGAFPSNKRKDKNNKKWRGKETTVSLSDRNNAGLSTMFPTPDCQINPSDIGTNFSTEHLQPIPTTGLRPVIVDGNNVALGYTKGHYFSSKALKICIEFFKAKGHEVIAFVPKFRECQGASDDPNTLKSLFNSGDVIFTPSRYADGVRITSYDDRYIVQTAAIRGGVIVSNDNYKDLLKESPSWRSTILYRLLPFTWIGDTFMLPNDPLGINGPNLEDFLKY